MPQDAGHHDAVAASECWQVSAFLTSDAGHRYAVAAAFVRTGPSTSKGHYLLYTLADLDDGNTRDYSVVDRTNGRTLYDFLVRVSNQGSRNQSLETLRENLDKGTLSSPYRMLPNPAQIRRARGVFSITMEQNSLAQLTEDGRVWSVALVGGFDGPDEWNLDLSLEAFAARPPLLPGGTGKVGLKHPDDTLAFSVTEMKAQGTLSIGGVVEKLTGTGNLDRQWGASWVVPNAAWTPIDVTWNWFSLQLSDGSDVVACRVVNKVSGKTVRIDITRLTRDGTTIVESAPAFALGEPEADGGAVVASADARWNQPRTGIVFPVIWTLTLPTSGLTLTIKPFFRDQTFPMFGYGDGVWQGAVAVTGTDKAGASVTGQGYMQLVGYRRPATATSAQRK